MATESRGESMAMTKESPPAATSVVVCSLEPWGEVRRRIRILVDELVELDPSVRVLYVAPAHDVPHEVRNRRSARGEPRFEQVAERVHVLRPRKWLPRAVGPFADRSLERQVLHAIHHLGLERAVGMGQRRLLRAIRPPVADGRSSTTSPTTGC